MEETAIHEEARETAKKIRNRLQREFPEYPTNHFSVNTKTDNKGATSVVVEWVDNPSYEEVSPIVKKYQTVHFNAQTDSQTYDGYVDEDGMRYFGAMFVDVKFSYSPERERVAKEWIEEQIRKDPSKANSMRNFRTQYIVCGYFDKDHQLMDKHNPNTYHTTIDRKELKDKMIEEVVEAYPLKIKTFPLMGVKWLGIVVDEDDLNVYVKITDLQIRAFIKGKLKEAYTDDFINRIVMRSMNHSQLISNKEKEKYNPTGPSGNITSYLSQYVVNKLEDTISKELRQISGRFEELPDPQNKQFVSEWYHEMGYRNLMKMQRALDINVMKRVDNLDEYINGKVLEAYFEFLKNKSKQNSNDSVALENINKRFREMNPEHQQRYVRVMSKNENELYKLMTESSYLVKNPADSNLVVMKYDTSVQNLSLYQTGFGMWCVQNSVENPHVYQFSTVYDVSSMTLKQCMQNARAIHKTFQLPNEVVVIAEKMYLR